MLAPGVDPVMMASATDVAEDVARRRGGSWRCRSCRCRSWRKSFKRGIAGGETTVKLRNVSSFSHNWGALTCPRSNCCYFGPLGWRNHRCCCCFCFHCFVCSCTVRSQFHCCYCCIWGCCCCGGICCCIYCCGRNWYCCCRCRAGQRAVIPPLQPFLTPPHVPLSSFCICWAFSSLLTRRCCSGGHPAGEGNPLPAGLLHNSGPAAVLQTLPVDLVEADSYWAWNCSWWQRCTAAAVHTAPHSVLHPVGILWQLFTLPLAGDCYEKVDVTSTNVHSTLFLLGS